MVWYHLPAVFSWPHATALRYFLYSLLITSLHKVCKWQISIILGCLAMTLFSMSCHNEFVGNMPWFHGFHLIFNIRDKYNYLWRLKYNAALNEVPLSNGEPRTGHMMSSYMTSSQDKKTFTSATFTEYRWSRGQGGTVFILSWRIDWHTTWPTWVIYQVWPWPNFRIDPSGPICIWFDASWCEKYAGVSFLRYIS